MSLPEIETAKREAVRARGRFDSTLAAVQARLRPGNLAEEAWDGVKEKSADIAENALEAVKQRPGTVSAVMGALALFLARKPLARAAKRLISDEKAGNEAEDAALSVEEGV